MTHNTNINLESAREETLLYDEQRLAAESKKTKPRRPRSEKVTTDSDHTLICPNCKDIYLHHESVEVFDRVEDASTGVHTTVEICETPMDLSSTLSKPVVDTNLDGNPSLRRSGIKIRFWCECCNAISVLTIAQHKGITYHKWEK